VNNAGVLAFGPVASVIAFLASEDAAFVNGVNLPVERGVTASNGGPNPTAALAAFGLPKFSSLTTYDFNKVPSSPGC
jgi:hypothetical protein